MLPVAVRVVKTHRVTFVGQHSDSPLVVGTREGTNTDGGTGGMLMERQLIPARRKMGPQDLIGRVQSLFGSQSHGAFIVTTRQRADTDNCSRCMLEQGHLIHPGWKMGAHDFISWEKPLLR